MSLVIGTNVSSIINLACGQKGIDFVKMRTAAQFCIIRAGQNLWVDGYLRNNWRAAKAAGIPRGSYWYFDSRTDPKRQVDLWIQALNGDYGELPLFLGLEERNYGQYTGWKHWKNFLDYLKMMVGNHEIGIYSSFSYFRENAPNALADPTNLQYFHQYPLWIANPGTTLPSPMIPRPWDSGEWIFWQYSPQGNGPDYGIDSANVDLNYFNGSIEWFNDRFDPAPAHSGADGSPAAFRESRLYLHLHCPRFRCVLPNPARL
jgi:lysozyme